MAETIRIDRYFPNGQLRDFCEVRDLPTQFRATLAQAVAAGMALPELAEFLSAEVGACRGCKLGYHLPPGSKKLCVSNGRGLITYSRPPDFTLQSFLAGATHLELVQEQRGVGYTLGQAELTLSLERNNRENSRMKVRIIPDAETRVWERELWGSEHDALNRYADELISYFITHGAQATIVEFESRRLCSSAWWIWRHRTDLNTNIVICEGKGWQSIDLYPSTGGRLLLRLRGETAEDAWRQEFFNALKVLEGCHGIVGWDAGWDATQRRIWKWVEQWVDEAHVVLPPDGYQWLDFLTEVGNEASLQVLKSPSQDRNLRLIQALGRVVLSVAHRAPHKISIMEVGLARDLRGYIRLANRLGAEAWYYFERVAPDTPAESKRRQNLKHYVELMASSPTKLHTKLRDRYGEGISDLPYELDREQKKAYAQLGRLFLLAEQEQLTQSSKNAAGIEASWCVKQEGRLFKFVLLKRPDLKVESWAGAQGIEKLRVFFPNRDFWQKLLRRPSTELIFEISSPSIEKSVQILRDLGALPSVKDARDFLKTECGRYLAAS